MNKCEEVFEAWREEHKTQSPLLIWQAAWNARGVADAEICEKWSTSNHVYVNGAIACYRGIKEIDNE